MIKVIAFDVYGTILALDDYHNDHPPRRGLEILLDKCEERGIIPVTASDEGNYFVQADLGGNFGKFPERGLKVKRFSDFFCLDQPLGKDYSLIIGHYDIASRELLVIDDLWSNISRALRLGCLAVHCPEYRVDEDEWGFENINLERN